jgi:hypothetical protein
MEVSFEPEANPKANHFPVLPNITKSSYGIIRI